ncbi:hypothetical protein [Streptomyces sp. NPDC057690]|uniref:hypothetical protein n=1 Tax=Streptomyces sp. NPDC057690 TaxID=3346214 RepID=UPI00368CA75C
MAEHAVRHPIGAAVPFLIALGTAMGPGWAQPQQAVGARTTLRAAPSPVPAKFGTLRSAHVGTVFTVGLSRSTPADYVPVTATVKGRVGDTVVVRLGVTNLGPGSPDGDAGSFAVVPPPGTTVTSIPWEGDDDDRRYSCRPPQDKDNYFFLCDFSPSAGSSITLGFHIRIDKRVPGAKGSVTVYGPKDTVPGNDRDTISVDATSAPLWRWQNPLWHWHHWPPAAATLAILALAGRWFARRRRQDQA